MDAIISDGRRAGAPTRLYSRALTGPGESSKDASRAAWSLLAALSLLNALNFLDRQFLAAVAPLVVAELGLSRTELGILLGFAFVLFFAFATLALGFFADRVSRTRLVAAGVALWSLMTAASGAARGFSDLAAARLFVGLGEAALVPSALSLLADRFPASRLGLASGLFWAGYPIGRALSYFVAGTVVPSLGWRSCFYALGALGILGSGAMLLFHDPPRPRAEGAGESGLGAVFRTFGALPSLRWVVLGNTFAAFAASASQLEVAWLVAERGFTPERAASVGGTIVAAASVVGNPTVGAVADRLERGRPGGRLLCLAALTAVVMPLAVGFYLLPPGTVVFYACWFAAQLALAGWQGVSSAAIQELSPPRTRAFTLASAVVFVNLLGIGPGAAFAGAVGDARSLTAGLLAAAVVGLAAVVPYLLAARGYARDRATVLSQTRPS